VLSKADEMASLIYRTAQKQKLRKNKIERPNSSEETVQAKVHGSSPEGKS